MGQDQAFQVLVVAGCQQHRCGLAIAGDDDGAFGSDFAALRALPKEYRVVLVLREMNSLSYEEISEVLGLPMGTVKSRVHRGRMLLKDRLRGYFQGERDAP